MVTHRPTFRGEGPDVLHSLGSYLRQVSLDIGGAPQSDGYTHFRSDVDWFETAPRTNAVFVIVGDPEKGHARGEDDRSADTRTAAMRKRVLEHMRVARWRAPMPGHAPVGIVTRRLIRGVLLGLLVAVSVAVGDAIGALGDPIQPAPIPIQAPPH